MKKCVIVLAAILACLCVIACLPMKPRDPTVPEGSSTRQPVPQGWQEADGNRYYYLANGKMATGWTDVAGSRYYFAADGVMQTGWLDAEGKRYYLDESGVMQVGWLEREGNRYYLRSDGAMAAGWENMEDGRRYFAADGVMRTGWVDAEGKRYYLDASGVMQTGWLERDGNRYYLKDDGSMARGMVEIEGVKTYFTSSGAYILLVNPWNPLPEGYAPELVTLGDNLLHHDGAKVDKMCYEALEQMLLDCKRECSAARVVSSYRTQAFQEWNYGRKVQEYLDKGYSRQEAERLAAAEVAVPGTSEHQSGLAVDIVDESWWGLTDAQANMPAQKWLMENCWRYGFILRFPKDKTEITGIGYEPWHYRYVGLEVAAEIRESGLSLEEYLNNLN